LEHFKSLFALRTLVFVGRHGAAFVADSEPGGKGE
jgi:hypothetical protein